MRYDDLVAQSIERREELRRKREELEEAEHNPATDLDAMRGFAHARLRECVSNTQATALYALLEEAIWPSVGANSDAGRIAAHALRLFVAQWSNHPDSRAEWWL